MTSSDQKLASKMRKGNAAAFEEIYRLHFPKIFYYASKYLADDEEARNIAQDTFMELWQRREGIDETLNIVSYMLTTARNKCLNVLRSNIIRNKYKDNLSKRTMAEMNYYALSERSAENILGQDLYGMVDNLLEQMPAPTRTAFLLSREEEMSYSEIASKMNISVKMVEYRISQALRVLRTKLKDFAILLAVFLLTRF